MAIALAESEKFILEMESLSIIFCSPFLRCVRSHCDNLLLFSIENAGRQMEQSMEGNEGIRCVCFWGGLKVNRNGKYCGWKLIGGRRN